MDSPIKLWIHVMDGLNYPLKPKTNLIIQFDLLTYFQERETETDRDRDRETEIKRGTETERERERKNEREQVKEIQGERQKERKNIQENILATVQTTHSVHPRQLVWDQKLCLPLSKELVQSLFEASGLAAGNGGVESMIDIHYYIKISLILWSEPESRDSGQRQVQATVLKELSEILKPLFLTNPNLLVAKSSPYSFTSPRQEIVLPLPFEPHLILPSTSINDHCVRIRIGLLLHEETQATSAKQSSNELTERDSFIERKSFEKFQRRSGLFV
jgi:hypothetical protein